MKRGHHNNIAWKTAATYWLVVISCVATGVCQASDVEALRAVLEQNAESRKDLQDFRYTFVLMTNPRNHEGKETRVRRIEGEIARKGGQIRSVAAITPLWEPTGAVDQKEHEIARQRLLVSNQSYWAVCHGVGLPAIKTFHIEPPGENISGWLSSREDAFDMLDDAFSFQSAYGVPMNQHFDLNIDKKKPIRIIQSGTRIRMEFEPPKESPDAENWYELDSAQGGLLVSAGARLNGRPNWTLDIEPATSSEGLWYPRRVVRKRYGAAGTLEALSMREFTITAIEPRAKISDSEFEVESLMETKSPPNGILVKSPTGELLADAPAGPRPSQANEALEDRIAPQMRIAGAIRAPTTRIALVTGIILLIAVWILRERGMRRVKTR